METITIKSTNESKNQDQGHKERWQGCAQEKVMNMIKKRNMINNVKEKDNHDKK